MTPATHLLMAHWMRSLFCLTPLQPRLWHAHTLMTTKPRLKPGVAAPVVNGDTKAPATPTGYETRRYAARVPIIVAGGGRAAVKQDHLTGHCQYAAHFPRLVWRRMAALEASKASHTYTTFPSHISFHPLTQNHKSIHGKDQCSNSIYFQTSQVIRIPVNQA
jgi:hypothetical protein